ncbi:MAG: glycosyltransferase [Acidobacteria bacterium]|nr:glycosyltransferase [Acidobacteriota bacterium]
MPFLLLMPSYNQDRFIGEAIRSCLIQDDPDWELWILDNSTDRTPEIVASFSDPRIHFEHRPGRTCPGACLNELIAVSSGDCFSYIHTDNNLAPNFVREMRRGLEGSPLSLAYCDLRLIDEKGAPTGLWRRPHYGLGTILGSESLGVPFAATTALARELGGFSKEDLADDTLFCSRAFGLGPWRHIPKPLVDYRIHGSSRTEQAGDRGVVQAVLQGHAKTLLELEYRGLNPLKAMAQRITDHLDELESALEDAWLKNRGQSLPVPNGELAGWLFYNGQFKLNGFGPKQGGPPKTSPLKQLLLRSPRSSFKGVRHEFMRRQAEFESVLVGWAWLSAGGPPAAGIKFQVRSLDFATLWCAKLLALRLGWEPMISPSAGPVPRWLRWPVAEHRGAWLDLRERPDRMFGTQAAATLDSDKLA